MLVQLSELSTASKICYPRHSRHPLFIVVVITVCCFLLLLSLSLLLLLLLLSLFVVFCCVVVVVVVVFVDVANDHLEDPASCMRSSEEPGLSQRLSGESGHLQIIFWRDRPLANDFLEGQATCK